MNEIHVECTIKTYKDSQPYGKTVDVNNPIRVVTGSQNTIEIWQEDNYLFCVDGMDLMKAIACCQRGQDK